MAGVLRQFLNAWARRKKDQFNRRVSIGDLLTERADNAAMYGFGEGTTMYDNVLVLGDVRVGPGLEAALSWAELGVAIGDQAVVGANSLVNCNLPPRAKAFGSPVRVR